jgi:NAD(P)H-dependent flavin oxidoreductase YrpB (nitropropane dioxygenase family)
MVEETMLSTSFTQLVGCTVPIQQAGMGGVATAGLAGAVADAGGLGMIGAVRMQARFLADVLDRLGQKTQGAFGVNFLMPFLDRECVPIAASKSRVVEFFYGDPDPELVKIVHDGGALASWQIGSFMEAQKAVDAGCDFIVAQGIEAGGHVRGKIGLFPLLDQVLEKVTVPVIAAGGIGSGRLMAAALSAGAEGVRIGTRFVAATESLAHPVYKEALIRSGPDDTILTERFCAPWANAPHRVLRSAVNAAAAFSGENVGEVIDAGVKVPIPRFGTPCPTRATIGKIEAMALYAGESVGHVRSIQPAAEIMREIMEGAMQCLGNWVAS